MKKTKHKIIINHGVNKTNNNHNSKDNNNKSNKKYDFNYNGTTSNKQER